VSDNILERPIPAFSTDLIKELDESIGSGLPEVDDTIAHIWIKVGQRMLVNSLLARLKRQEESILKGQQH
jgi:hypothetical protein